MDRLTRNSTVQRQVSVTASYASCLFAFVSFGCANQQPYPYNCAPYGQGYATNPYAAPYNAAPYPYVQPGTTPIVPSPAVGTPLPAGQYPIPNQQMYSPQPAIPQPMIGS